MKDNWGMDAKQIIPAALAIDGLGEVDARGGFAVAAEAGYRGVAFATNHRELNPDMLGPSGRRQVKALLAGKGLVVESVRAAAPRGGLSDAGTIDRTLDQARKAMNMAREMGVRTVAVHVGSLGGGAGDGLRGGRAGGDGGGGVAGTGPAGGCGGVDAGSVGGRGDGGAGAGAEGGGF